MTLIAGAGGGKGGKPRTPVEEDDTLQSVQFATVIDLISEGEIEGLDTGDGKSIFLDGTPLLDNLGNPNFSKYSTDFRAGTQDQTALDKAEGIKSVTGVGTTPTNSNGTESERIAGAVTRSFTNTNVDAVRVTISLPTLQNVENDGDIRGTSVKLQIEVKYDSGSYATVFPNNADGSASTGQVISGKSSSAYQRDFKFDIGNFSSSCSIRVSRVSVDSGSAKLANAFEWSSYTTIIEDRLRYPNSALSYLRFDSRSFQNVPQRKYKVKGIKIRLPSNASVDTTTHIGRVTYSGVWNGSFGAAIWCNDPAWILWDLMTNSRYGANIPESSLDKWDFYNISQYCNELVPNGRGGEEPRFSCNVLINERIEIYNAISALTNVFRGISYYASGSLVMLQDKPTDSQYILGPTNVINGAFAYTGVSQSARHSCCSVAYQNYDTLGEIDYENVEDADAISKYGIKHKELRAIGCYSQGQAHRVAKWVLLSEQNLTETVTFTVGVDSGLILRPGMVIDIIDPTRGNLRRSGRVSSATTTAITVDSRTDLDAIDMTKNPKIAVMMPTGLLEERTITAIEAVFEKQIDISPALSEAPNNAAQFIIQTDDIEASQFRVIGVTESDGEIYAVNALAYNSSIYDAIEQNLKVTQRDISNLTEAPSAVSGITGSEYLYQMGQGVFVGFNLSWSRSGIQNGALTSDYMVDYRIDDDNWQTVSSASPSVNLTALKAGVLEVRIVARNFVGKTSPSSTETFTLQGKIAPPADVQNLTFESINDNSGRLRWTQSTDLDVKVGGKIFIRHSSLTDGSGTWSNSTDLIDAKAGNATEAVIPKVTGEVLVKFADSSGILSTNEASVLITAAEKNQILVVKTQREDEISPTPFSGSKTNCEYDASADVLQLSVTSGSVASSGTYSFAETLDLGATYALDLVRYSVTRGSFVDDNIDSWPDVDARSDWDGGIIDSVNSSPQVRTTTDNPSGSPTWGSWQPLANGVFSGRGFQFKIDLTSTTTNQNILVDQLGYTATLGQRTEQSVGVVASTTASGGKTITFSKAFFTGTSALGGSTSAYLPSIGIVAQNMQTGDFFSVTAVSDTAFTVKFMNGSSVVDRNFYWTAVGYGKRV